MDNNESHKPAIGKTINLKSLRIPRWDMWRKPAPSDVDAFPLPPAAELKEKDYEPLFNNFVRLFEAVWDVNLSNEQFVDRDGRTISEQSLVSEIIEEKTMGFEISSGARPRYFNARLQRRNIDGVYMDRAITLTETPHRNSHSLQDATGVILTPHGIFLGSYDNDKEDFVYDSNPSPQLSDDTLFRLKGDLTDAFRLPGEVKVVYAGVVTKGGNIYHRKPRES